MGKSYRVSTVEILSLKCAISHFHKKQDLQLIDIVAKVEITFPQQLGREWFRQFWLKRSHPDGGGGEGSNTCFGVSAQPSGQQPSPFSQESWSLAGLASARVYLCILLPGLASARRRKARPSNALSSRVYLSLGKQEDRYRVLTC